MSWAGELDYLSKNKMAVSLVWVYFFPNYVLQKNWTTPFRRVLAALSDMAIS